MTERRYNGSLSADSPDRKRGPAVRYGKEPQSGQDPLFMAEIHDKAGAIWHVTQVRANIGPPGKRLARPKLMPDSDWRNCKLHVIGSARHKANYWLSLSVKQRRISARWDAHALIAIRPDLYAALTALVEYWPKTPGLDEGLTVRVKPNGDAFVCEDILTAEDVMMQLDAMPIGGYVTLECSLEMLKAAVGMLASKRFTAIASLFKGLDVTRVS